MTVTLAGAISISTSKTEQYTLSQQAINSIVALAPNVLGRFKQEPTIIKSESFTRDGVPLSAEEVSKQKETMVADALRQFDNPFTYRDEQDGGPGLRHATMTFGVGGKMETVIGDVVDRKGDSIKAINAISNETKAALLVAGIDLQDVIRAIESHSEPTKMASRVGKVIELLDSFKLAEASVNQLHARLNDFVMGNCTGNAADCSGSFADAVASEAKSAKPFSQEFMPPGNEGTAEDFVPSHCCSGPLRPHCGGSFSEAVRDADKDQDFSTEFTPVIKRAGPETPSKK